MSAGSSFWAPTEFRQFIWFPRLPREIRNKIWEEYICDPGIDFVKLKIRDRGLRHGLPLLRQTASATLDPKRLAFAKNGGKKLDKLDESDLLVIKDDFKPMRAVAATIVPESPSARADISEYKLLTQKLMILRRTCVESATFVKSMLRRRGILRLENGTIVTLNRSDDLVCLEYLPHEDYANNCPLNVVLVCPGLESIRRVAMRFCHDWQPARESSPCKSCGKPHQTSAKGIYPTHLYQFLARNLPNLEEFYFLDYYIVPKPPSDILGRHTDRIKKDSALRYFRTKDRILFEFQETAAYAKEWACYCASVEIRDWLRNHFVRYAKASHLSRHKRPEQVHFGVLACEWNVSAPYARKSPVLKATTLPRLDIRGPFKFVGTKAPNPERGANAALSQGNNPAGTRPGDSPVYHFGSASRQAFKFQFTFMKRL